MEDPVSIYSKLGPDITRVFELFPASDGMPIAGSLRDIHLKFEHESYEALSYAWGDTTPRKTVSCDGTTIHITENLHRILSLLRRSDVSLVLWVDALCINQGTDDSALEDKAQQIPMMNTIFASASRVIIDLGETKEDFDYLLILLEQYTRMEADAIFDMDNTGFTLPGSEVSDLIDIRFWQQLFSLIRLPWFRRLWCFQEFVLAHEIVTVVGSRLVDHFDLHLAISLAFCRLEIAAAQAEADLSELITDFTKDGEYLRRSFNLLHRKQRIREIQQDGDELLLDALFVGSRMLEVTDPRDRIYAIHSLLPSDLRDEIYVDYSEDVQALQVRFSQHLVRKNLGMWALILAIGPNQQLPSWTMTVVTDTELYWAQEWFAICSGSLDNFTYCTDGSTFCGGGMLPWKLDLDQSLEQITTEGCIFDNIKSLSDNFLPMRRDDHIQSMMNHVSSMMSVMQWAKLNEISDDVLWRILTLDGYGHLRADKRYRDSDQRDAVFRTSFQAWKNYINCVQTDYSDLETLMGYVKTGKLFYQSWVSGMPNMRLAMTEKEYPAAVPYITEATDQIAILCGVPCAFVFRPMGTYHQIVGPCFLYGLMEGQALDHKDWKTETLTIV